MSRFNELAKAKITDNRNLVISEREAGGLTLAQQLVVDEGKHRTFVFLQGAVNTDLEGLIEVRDAINEALEKLSHKKN